MHRFIHLPTVFFTLLFALLLGACQPKAPQTLRLATTTSTADSGLLDEILPIFEKNFNAKVEVIAVGTGQALELGQNGDVDVVLVHARSREDEFVAQAYGINRRDVMYNDFVIVGPADDPAGIVGIATSAAVFQRIVEQVAFFASRGDDSGTHSKEKSLWKTAGIEPQGDWYLSTGQGMGETLQFANEKGAYTLTDRATWLAQKENLPNLKIVFGGERITENPDQSLYNPYGVIPVNPEKHEGIHYPLAEQFASWLVSAETQKLIGEFGMSQYGQPLFYPSAQ
ncbi:MAG TPA: substrate-binding domain-containing protein [Anaerolineales bacterium]|nr:substrate-binding domain-containing protein [Anaerolineales bacterium]